VTIVTYNSARYIRRCLETVFKQTHRASQIVVIDNNSSDGTVALLKELEGPIQVVYNKENTGFAAAQNQAIGLTRTDWVLVLNPDVLLLPDFIERMAAAGETNAVIGTVCGKLLTMSPELELPAIPVVDSTGIYFTPALRHLDRGSQAEDTGRYDEFEYVFGATGAAALYRRSMIDDISIDGEFFDVDFFAYREDADVAWRAQLLNWKCLYTPQALAYHVRSVLPGNRRTLPAVINMHSVKNRCFLRIKNVTSDLYWRHWLTITLRDGVVVTACLTREFSSLKAFPMVAASYSRFKKKRREIMRKRRASDEYMAAWFSFRPVSYPAPDVARKLTREKAAIS
jgi:GT2 family glycosyltransferase